MFNDTVSQKYAEVMKRFDTADVQNPITHRLIQTCFMPRPADAYKGSCGSLFVCAGSKGLTGAAIMACKSALRCGCGLITLGCAESLNTVFETNLIEVMTMPLADRNGVISAASYPDILAKADKSDAVLLGPGLSRCEDISLITKQLVQSCRVPLIIDADGINSVSENTDMLKNASCPVILTPHVGEFARLTGKDTGYILQNRHELARDFAMHYGVTLVLKSHRTIVAATDGMVYENVLGNPGMAKGGSGDVLAGAIASLAAQGNGSLSASLAGVYIHSLAADMAVLETGEYSLIPEDIIEYIKYAVRETSRRL